MPFKPKTACRMPGCPHLTPSGETYCEEHKREQHRTYNKKRKSANELGYNFNWAKVRKQKIKRNPLCERCEGQGKTKQTEVVHHINEDPKDNRMENLESLCNRCHLKTHREPGGSKSSGSAET